MFLLLLFYFLIVYWSYTWELFIFTHQFSNWKGSMLSSGFPLAGLCQRCVWPNLRLFNFLLDLGHSFSVFPWGSMEFGERMAGTVISLSDTFSGWMCSLSDTFSGWMCYRTDAHLVLSSSNPSHLDAKEGVAYQLVKTDACIQAKAGREITEEAEWVKFGANPGSSQETLRVFKCHTCRIFSGWRHLRESSLWTRGRAGSTSFLPMLVS